MIKALHGVMACLILLLASCSLGPVAVESNFEEPKFEEERTSNLDGGIVELGAQDRELLGLSDFHPFEMHVECREGVLEEIKKCVTGPERATCLLRIEYQDGSLMIGTGFFVAPRLVLTAGHNVVRAGNGDDTKRWAKRITVVPGTTSRFKAPFGVYPGERVYSVAGWSMFGRREYDFGAVVLRDTAAYEKVGSSRMDLTVATNEMLQDGNFQLMGYHEGRGYSLHRSKAKDEQRLSITPSQLEVAYKLDSVLGVSGGPVSFADRQGEVVAVHQWGLCPNIGTRITEERKRQILGWNPNQ